MFEFIRYVDQLPKFRRIFPFGTSEELRNLLRSQLSGLFLSILQEKRREQIDDNTDRLLEGVEALRGVLTELQAREESARQAERVFMKSRHPLFHSLQEAAEIPIRIAFDDVSELDSLFEYAGFRRVSTQELPREDARTYMFWSGKGRRIGVNRGLFSSDDPTGELLLPYEGPPRRDWLVVR